ncbi:MAG: 16S rRNA (cytosine(1402)-N(4))-methyltransferase RsmH [Rikenellaceae bacterium]|nr:16S rRNA (cytosine(1402)-N(4))-methyltransferase RsmH [Rikenellaceae bacterium]
MEHQEYHIPVLLHESINLLNINESGIYADMTFGGGGHSRAILKKLGPDGRLLCFDQDSDTFNNIPDDERLIFVHNNFKYLRNCSRYFGFDRLDGIIADLGVSSHHFDDETRGFSYRFDTRLDMRMNRSAGLTAMDVINNYDETQLKNIFKYYGELDTPGRIARNIVNGRENKTIETVTDLIELAGRPAIKAEQNKFLAKLFQALRIEVNGEMEALKMMLEQSLKMLNSGGRLVVITYHSLEDRLVKNFMKHGNVEGIPEKDFFGNSHSYFKLITKKAIEPSAEEIEKNSRSRSAKLRVAEKW